MFFILPIDNRRTITQNKSTVISPKRKLINHKNLVTASRHSDGSQKNPEVQTRKSGHVRLGDPGAAHIAACLRTPQHSFSQLC
jgi:hypothetical protein